MARATDLKGSARLLTKAVLPVRALALSPSGATAAVAGDDAGIKLLTTESCKVLRVLESDPYIRGLAFDPEGIYLAAVSATGTLTLYNTQSGKVVLSRKSMAAKVRGLGSSCSCTSFLTVRADPREV